MPVCVNLMCSNFWAIVLACFVFSYAILSQFPSQEGRYKVTYFVDVALHSTHTNNHGFVLVFICKLALHLFIAASKMSSTKCQVYLTCFATNALYSANFL